jgi:hypothetical protein
MRPVPEAWNINVVGNWNIAILSPAWLGANIFGAANFQLEMSVAGVGALKIRFGDVDVIPSPVRLIVAPAILNNETLVKCEEAARKIIENLPHTPLAGIGINMGYLEPNPDDLLLNRFEDRDSNLFADHGFIIEKRTFARQIDADGQQINLTVGVDQAGVKFDFNFHSIPTTPHQTTESLRDKILVHKSKALELLQSVYSLTPEV